MRFARGTWYQLRYIHGERCSLSSASAFRFDWFTWLSVRPSRMAGIRTNLAQLSTYSVIDYRTKLCFIGSKNTL